MNSNLKISLVGLILCFLASSSLAGRYWPSTTLSTWELQLNNGVAYISSTDFASHCKHSRGQINMDGTEFNKALYAYAMSAKARGKKLNYVVDSDDTYCVVSGLIEVD